MTTENAEVAEKAELILIGVKPGVVLQVVDEIADAIEGKLVISLAAGIRVTSLEGKAKARFMRAMTNTPAAVCQAATALARGARTTEENLLGRGKFFPRSDSSSEVKEEQIDAVTALAGSGPASFTP